MRPLGYAARRLDFARDDVPVYEMTPIPELTRDTVTLEGVKNLWLISSWQGAEIVGNLEDLGELGVAGPAALRLAAQHKRPLKK